MKRTAVAMLMALLFLAVIQFVNVGRANPYYRGGHTAPPEGAEPAEIYIFSPEKDMVFASNNVSLSFNVTLSDSTYELTHVWIEGDWQEGNTSFYHLYVTTDDYRSSQNWITEFSHNETLIGIPEGKHRIRIFATARGYYVDTNGIVVGALTAYTFDITGFSSVYFSIENDFPAAFAFTASEISVGLIGVGLLVYLRKRRG